MAVALLRVARIAMAIAPLRSARALGASDRVSPRDARGAIGPGPALQGERVELLGVDPEGLDRRGGLGGLDRAAARQLGHRGRGDVRRIDLEHRAQVLARVAAPEAVRAERQEVGVGSQRATMSGSDFIQSVAATIGPPSCGSTWLTYGIRRFFASGWSRFQRSASRASRRSSGNDGAL